MLFFDTRLFHIHTYYNPSRSPFSIITSPPPPLANGHKRSGRWTQINIHIDTECIATGATRNSTDPEKLELVPVSSSFFPLPLLSNELERKKFYLFLFLAQNSRRKQTTIIVDLLYILFLYNSAGKERKNKYRNPSSISRVPFFISLFFS